MLIVKQYGIKYRFLSLWYDSTWDWTPVSRTIGEYSTHYVHNKLLITYKIIQNSLKIDSTH